MSQLETSAGVTYLHLDAASPEPARARILLLYTGGTVGMVYDAAHSLVPFDFTQILARVPELRQFQYHLTVAQFNTPIDSSNVTPAHWLTLARLIEQHYEEYDGFVILHGTDTMAYTASALSFILEGLSKPVVLTGAQVPIGKLRTDARENIITALEVAGAQKNGRARVPEVCICFGNLVLRGNRSKKVESVHFDAFKSENYPPLGEAGVEIEWADNYLAHPPAGAPLKLRSELENRVMILKLFPGITETVVRCILLGSGVKGVVMETYGSGNAPTEEWFLNLLREATEAGVTILNVSQCDEGRVDQGRYETSRYLLDLGVIGGADITTEAAITKLMVVLGMMASPVEIRKLLAEPLCGEMETGL